MKRRCTVCSDEAIFNEVRRRNRRLTENECLAIEELCEMHPVPAGIMFKADHPDFGQIVVTKLDGEWYRGQPNITREPT